MKKSLVAIVALLYITTSSGITLHLHYCMGKLAGWGFMDNNTSTICDGCGMTKMDEKGNGCCQDDHKFFKNSADQKISEGGFQIIQLIAAALPGSSIEIPSIDFPSVIEENPISHAPPRDSSVKEYILNCVFLI